MSLPGIAAVVAGVAFVGLNLFDVFVSVILPRGSATRWRASVRIVRLTWPIWTRVTRDMTVSDRRQDVLGTYAPFILVLFLFVWAFGCVVGYGLIFYGLRTEVHPVASLGEAIYLAGASFLTIGYGDVVPIGGAARAVGLFAGASGFAVIAIVTSFLFQLFAAFGARENFVVALGARAGSPPSGVTLLETYARYGAPDDLDHLFDDGIRWAAMVLETHIAYPILAYFRSSHDFESWVAALGALLDASALKIALIDDGPPRNAKFFHTLGRHLVHDLAAYFRLSTDAEPGVEWEEFASAHARLQAAGLKLRDADEAWLKFAELRGAYASALNAMALYWRIPPAQWIGDRSSLRDSHPVSTPIG